ncbi:hypothetical protein U1Q18_010746, partial [Sarracenia purpurea var. burkii]
FVPLAQKVLDRSLSSFWFFVLGKSVRLFKTHDSLVSIEVFVLPSKINPHGLFEWL